MKREGAGIIRIAVFYDGNFFYHASNYYYYEHRRRMRLSIHGLHDFIRYEAARREGVDQSYCQIVDAHYFRGRLVAQEAEERQVLLQERLFDDVLMREGIVTHYLPVGRQGEKGIDVWLALEALELASMKRFDVLALIAGDSDYVPLIRKLNNLGTRVMVLGWDFEFEDSNGNIRRTSTSARLYDEASYPIPMQAILDDRSRPDDPVIRNLFVQSDRGAIIKGGESSAGTDAPAPDPAVISADAGLRYNGPVRLLKNGYGFVGTETPGRDLFFVWHDIENASFDGLAEGDMLEYAIGVNERGEYARELRLIEKKAESVHSLTPQTGDAVDDEPRYTGRVVALKNGYGFIATDQEGRDLFFVKSDLENVDFENLHSGDLMEYSLGVNDRGECARYVRRLAVAGADAASMEE